MEHPGTLAAPPRFEDGHQQSVAAGRADGVNSAGSAAAWEYATRHGFWSIGGPRYTGNFYLNIWVDPRHMTDALRDDIVRIDAEAQTANTKSDLDVVLDSLFSFPIA